MLIRIASDRTGNDNPFRGDCLLVAQPYAYAC